MSRPVVVLLGKVPPPYMGPAIATRILLESSLIDYCRLIHLDTRAHRSLHDMGRFGIMKSFRTLLIYLRMAGLMLRHRPDLVIVPVSQSVTGFLKDAFYVLIARAFGRKVILHLRGSDFRNRYEHAGNWFRTFVRFICDISSGVIVQGECLRPIFEGLFTADRIHIIPNGADFSFPAKSRVGEDTEVRLLYLANLQASKGILDLLEAIEILKKRLVQDFSLDVVGDWRDEETKRTALEIVELNSSPVRFHAPATGIAKLQYLVDADVFVFPPRAPEGHPWVIVEAQAAGLPIVATDRGAIAEVVEDGRSGFIVAPEQPEVLADRLERLIADGSLRRAFGVRNRSLYLEKYTEEKMVERFRRLIGQLTGEQHR
ncbi:MAG: glycosyltransferase family 4 protein [Bacteroidota bacterium]